MKRIPAVLLLVVLAGCMGLSQQPIARIPFPAEQYNATVLTGTATITGQAFLLTRGGDTKYAAGKEVILTPVTAYSEQWYQTVVTEDREIAEADWRESQFEHRVTADGEGRFTFRKVGPGAYFVRTLIQWQYVCRGYLGYTNCTTGGWVAKRIAVRDGDSLTVVLTQ